jgi:hypothetical protein
MDSTAKIRKLYQEILARNGRFLSENNQMIAAEQSSPDGITFGGEYYHWNDPSKTPSAFSLIGDPNSPILLTTRSTHLYIFNALRTIKSEFGHISFDEVLRGFGVSACGELTEENLNYFYANQRDSAMGRTRIATKSGRIFRDIKAAGIDGAVDVVAFWCNQGAITESDLLKIKECFNSERFYWTGINSQNYNYFEGNVVDRGTIKELKSKKYPELSHDDIVDILMRAHSDYKLKPFEKEVVWEFRGIDPSEITPPVTGGYDTRAEYEFRSRQSEACEKFEELYKQLKEQYLK